MRADLATAFLFFIASALPSAAQAPARPGDLPATTGTAATPPVIACASLANLRMVLRGAKDDPSAAVQLVTDPKSDLGCSVLDRKAVTGITDHVALNGRAYECLGMQNTSICQWTVAGSVVPPAANSAPGRGTPASPPPGKSKR
ncbi:hypothetical protein [Methylobacterium gnaphalii]|uniref:Uncharacterized protein n=1 Tax=Methylobacterium gnaphalii TaxID=1010610 RepID=A0A512JLA3_9HYPH|nr:hypothetical protein [Methylobacterium gnaphalii]GEP10730.1 hypothetical protein MGN01_25750 [Methylobacterium gnaphalii]GJD67398.1 hypothetical protein MMMDOFMJ_0313 [Methylobacterium gnaphalii]GLS49270.1 hypothetical protein GCM10007885_21180 [Methylobacterium gnaphalii]